MAFPAFRFFVGAGQFIAGELVLKFIFIEPNEVERPSVVFVVATGTGFAFYLFGNVKPFVLNHPAFELLVAIEAFIVGHFLTQHMAFGTVGDTFQFSVRFRQVARRKLCPEVAGNQQEHRKSD